MLLDAPKLYAPAAAGMTKADRVSLWLKEHSRSERSFSQAIAALLRASVQNAVRVILAATNSSEALDRLAGDAFREGFLEVARRFVSLLVARGAAHEWAMMVPRRKSFHRLDLQVDVANLVAGRKASTFLMDLPPDVRAGVERHTEDIMRRPYWRDVSDDVRQDIADIIREGLTAGRSKDDIAGEITDSYGSEFSRRRASTIARTESTGALNAGADLARRKLRELGVIKGREWLAVIDNKTREDHVDANGQKVNLDENFVVGGESCRFPGDPDLSPEQRVNCRCTTLSVLIDAGEIEDTEDGGKAESDEDEDREWKQGEFWPEDKEEEDDERLDVFGTKLRSDIRSALGMDNVKLRDIRRLTGFPEGDSEFQIDSYGGSVSIGVKSENYDALRFVKRDADGKVFMKNEYFRVKDPDMRGKGFGTEVFKRQVEEAAMLGIDRIETSAAGWPGSSIYNGYYTWPRLGYDADLPAAIIKRLPDHLSKAKRVSDLMMKPAGRLWWKNNGSGLEMTFDVKPGSLSRRILDEYAASKGIKAVTISKRLSNFRQLLGVYEHPPELDAADEELLDAIWDGLGESLTTKATEVTGNLCRVDQGEPDGGQFVACDGGGGSSGGDSPKVAVPSGRPGFVPADKATPEQKAGIRVPPAWKDVQFNADPKARLRATGVDAKGRTQYLYSADHKNDAAAEKWRRVQGVISKVKDIDRQAKATMRLKRSPDRDTAAATYLIRKTGIRVGSDRDTKADKKAYGASTLLSDHVKVDGNKVHLSFVGKKGVQIDQTLEDKAMADFFRERLPRLAAGERIFDTTRDRVDGFMKRIAGEVYSPKDLRTAIAAETALSAMKGMEAPKTQTAFNKARRAVGDAVAARLGNTRTIALASYVPPEVFSRWQSKIKPASSKPKTSSRGRSRKKTTSTTFLS